MMMGAGTLSNQSHDRMEHYFNRINMQSLKAKKAQALHKAQQNRVFNQIPEEIQQARARVEEIIQKTRHGSSENGMYTQAMEVADYEPPIIETNTVAVPEEPMRSIPIESQNNELAFAVFNSNTPYYIDLLPKVLYRLHNFYANFDSEVDISERLKIAQYNFIIDNPNVFIIIIVKDNEIVGHCFLEKSNWCGKTGLLISQLELEIPLTRGISAKLLRLWKALASRLGITELRAFVHDAHLAKLYKQRFHAKVSSAVVDLDITSTNLDQVELE